MVQSLYWVFMGRYERIRVNMITLGLNSLYNFGGPWAIWVVPRCPVPSPGFIQGRGILPWCVSLIKDMVGSMGSGLVCLYTKGSSQGSSSLSRN